MRDFPRDGLLRLARLFFDTLIWTNPQRTEKLDLRPLMVTSTNSPKWECHYLRGFFQHEFVVASESLKIKSFTSHSKQKFYKNLRAKRASFTFWVDKSSLEMPKLSILVSFWKPEACGQKMLPDRSTLIGQKWVENTKIQKFLWYILGNFQTMRLAGL